VLDVCERARRRRRNLGINLVGRDFEQRLITFDMVADVLQPFVIVPSAMDSPICGITTSVAMMTPVYSFEFSVFSESPPTATEN